MYIDNRVRFTDIAADQQMIADERVISFTGFDAEELRTGLTLEVGCGYGRYLDAVQRKGGTIITPPPPFI